MLTANSPQTPRFRKCTENLHFNRQLHKPVVCFSFLRVIWSPFGFCISLRFCRNASWEMSCLYRVKWTTSRPHCWGHAHHGLIIGIGIFDLTANGNMQWLWNLQPEVCPWDLKGLCRRPLFPSTGCGVSECWLWKHELRVAALAVLWWLSEEKLFMTQNGLTTPASDELQLFCVVLASHIHFLWAKMTWKQHKHTQPTPTKTH